MPAALLRDRSVNGEWDVKQIRKLLEEELPRSARGRRISRWNWNFAKLGRRTLVINARRLETRGEFAVLLAIEDITGDRVRPSTSSKMSPTKNTKRTRKENGRGRETRASCPRSEQRLDAQAPAVALVPLGPSYPLVPKLRAWGMTFCRAGRPSLGTRLFWKLQLPAARRTGSRSCAQDKCVPKLELGHEENRGLPIS